MPSDARFQRGSFRLFRVAGIDVFLHWSWVIIAYFRIQARIEAPALEYTSPVWYVVEYVAVFAIVLLHEFGHVLACRQVGGTANRIVLWPLGGVALVSPPPRPGAFLWSLAAGPLVNLVLVPPTVGLAVLSHFAGWEEAVPDVDHFLFMLAVINGVLLFNLLPIFPLDGGQILQALLWFVIGRAHSLLVVTVIGLVTGLGLLAFALWFQFWWLSVLAGFAVFSSLAGLRHARTLLRTLHAPRREGAACPFCGTAPPVGDFWLCPRCLKRFDLFEEDGTCPQCSTPLTHPPCLECGRRHAFADWFPEVVPSAEVPEGPRQPVAVQAPSRPQPRPPSLGARVGCAAVLAVIALGIGLAISGGDRPADLIVWALGGALLGATSAGPLTRAWKVGRARNKLTGTWRLVEEDGHSVPADEETPPRLILAPNQFEERVGSQLIARGACWLDPATAPPSITLTPSTGPDRGQSCPGIYRLEGKVLTVCLARPGAPRPTEFVARPGVQQLRVYRRGRRGSFHTL